MTKRKTRSSNREDDEDICGTDLHKTNRSRGKTIGARKVLFDEQSGVNSLVDEPVSTTSESVPLDQQENNNDNENSPRPLIIDTDKEAPHSQPIMSDYFPRREPLGERLPRRVCNDSNKTQKNLTTNPTRVMSDENRTPVIDRTTDGQSSTNIRSQSSTSRVIVSVDRRQRNSNDYSNQNHRTSTPIRPTRPPQMNVASSDDYLNSFSVDSIPQDTYNMLSRFSEFRRLLKSYNSEKKKCQAWEKDFARLQSNYKQLEQNSFPRPPAPAMNFLVDLVDIIKQSSGRADPRTDEQIARDLKLTPLFLMGLKDPNPQQTALNLFHHFYPGYEAKLSLGSTNNLEIKKPGLLETILTFSQRAAPGTNYKLQQLRDCLNSSIRSARHCWNKLQHSIAHPEHIRKKKKTNHTQFQVENDLNEDNEYSTDTDNVITKGPGRDERLDDDDDA